VNIREICYRYGRELLEDITIAPYTSFKIGGNCNIVKINNIALLRELLMFCKKNAVQYRILGKGSNVLISSGGLKGLILLLSDDFAETNINGDTIECMAGARLSSVCKAAYEKSLTGLEFAYGIPGSVGGAIYMNAGAYGGEMSNIVTSCEYIDVGCFEKDELPIKQIAVEDMSLSYRHSIFTDNDWVITKAIIRLKKGDKTAIKTQMTEISDKRREKQPLELPSAGSTFKRPPGHFAAKLIDDCGLRGKTVGGAMVSEKHAGFVVNKGGATFDDVTRLIKLIQDDVFDKTGIMLEREVEVWE